MNIEIRADRYEEEQKLARASYLLDQFVIEQEDYDFLENYDKSLIKGFEKDPLYKAIQIQIFQFVKLVIFIQN